MSAARGGGGRLRPRQLQLRRTSSCSALPLGQLCTTNGLLNGDPFSSGSGFTCSGNLCCIASQRNGSAEYTAIHPALQVNQVTLPTLREGVEHISDLDNPDPNCHFCREPKSRSVHEDCTRLKIVSRGDSSDLACAAFKCRHPNYRPSNCRHKIVDTKL
jgi:hypothetical protein